MQWLVTCYDKVLEWSQHKYAPRYLAFVSVIEASLFPIPPYFMLAPMVMTRPDKAQTYATIATISSVCGGIIGYFLGSFIFKPVVLPILEYFNQVHAYENALSLFSRHGFMALLFLGVTPIPYKFVAIGAGFLNIPLYLFVPASIVSRGLKFFVLAFLVRAGGTNLTNFVRMQIKRFGLLLMGLLGVVLFVSLKVIGSTTRP